MNWRRATSRPCTLAYHAGPDSPPSRCHGIIQDLFLRLADGFELRLDNLVAVDDKELRDYC